MNDVILSQGGGGGGGDTSEDFVLGIRAAYNRVEVGAYIRAHGQQLTATAKGSMAKSVSSSGNNQMANTIDQFCLTHFIHLANRY